jgi:hypothetical protein
MTAIVGVHGSATTFPDSRRKGSRPAVRRLGSHSRRRARHPAEGSGPDRRLLRSVPARRGNLRPKQLPWIPTGRWAASIQRPTPWPAVGSRR